MEQDGPVMFINSVNSNVTPLNKTTYDSRNKENLITNINKWQYLVNLYQQDKKVHCKISTKDNEYFTIPSKLTNEEVVLDNITIKTIDIINIEIISFIK